MCEAEQVKQFGLIKTSETDPGSYPIKFEIAKLEVGDGELLVMTTDRHLSTEQFNFLRKLNAEQFAPFRVAILEGGFTLSVIKDKRTKQREETGA